MKRLGRITSRVAAIISLALIFFARASDGTLGDSSDHPAWNLAMEAVNNQFRGGYNGQLEMIRSSYLRGSDTLRGRFEISDPIGERTLDLRQGDEQFRYVSRDFGREQWWLDGQTGRLRRVPQRSLKKPAFESQLSFEDLVKLPADYLLEFSQATSLSLDDSSYALGVDLKPNMGSQYVHLNLKLSRNPILVLKIQFTGYGGRLIKTMDISDYQPMGNQWMPGLIRVLDADSLSSTELRWDFTQGLVSKSSGSDHTSTMPVDALSRIMGRHFKSSRLAPAPLEKLNPPLELKIKPADSSETNRKPGSVFPKL